MRTARLVDSSALKMLRWRVQRLHRWTSADGILSFESLMKWALLVWRFQTYAVSGGERWTPSTRRSREQSWDGMPMCKDVQSLIGFKWSTKKHEMSGRFVRHVRNLAASKTNWVPKTNPEETNLSFFQTPSMTAAQQDRCEVFYIVVMCSRSCKSNSICDW